VKSPWSSWQFGINYFSNNGTGRYRGRGDKDKKYIFNGIYTRENWKVKNAMNIAASNGPTGSPITLGNENISSWQNANSDSSGGVTIEKDSSISSGTNGNRSWGLVDLRDLKEPINEVEILAHISPKEVTKQAISLNITEPRVQTLEAPVVNPQVNTPLEPPKIIIPEVEEINITALNINTPEAPSAPGAPSINILIAAPGAPTPPNVEVKPESPKIPVAPNISIVVNAPVINPLTIKNPAQITPPNITSPTVKPVDFTVDPGGDSGQYSSEKHNNHQGWKDSWSDSPINVTELGNRNYVSLTRDVKNSDIPERTVINVTAENNRAMVVDEVNTSDHKVEFHGKINLQKSKNVGIDLQGTHIGNKTNPAYLTVINSGTIKGEAKNGGINNKEQIAFGFNNADGSHNATMTHMVNKGTITLSAPSSAAIQLKPEDPHNWRPNSWDAAPLNIISASVNGNYSRVLMKADNQKDINLNGSGSFGILTVFNKGVPENLFASGVYENLLSERNYGGVRVLPGGEIGRSALSDPKFISGIYNTGNINISGDESIGVGLLQEIQEVKVNGNINIGTNYITQEDDISNLTNKDKNKVELAIGVYAGVPTMPLKPGEKDTLAVDGNENTTSSTIGTEVVELNGTITLGEYATSSIGAFVGDTEIDLNAGKLNGTHTSDRKLKRSGDIMAKNSSVITVGGNKNYGFVVSNSGHSSKFSGAVDDLIYSVDKNNHGIGKNEGKINVTGTESAGFAMLKGGNSENNGSISVKESAANSIGFYGEEDQFTNKGIIEIVSSGKKNKAVVLNGKNGNKIKFINEKSIFVNVSENSNTNLDGHENIGVYAQGNYEFNHKAGAQMKIGSDGIGLYIKDTTGTVNIESSIDLAESKNATTIGVYSDGNAKVNFGTNSSLNIGKGGVGLYSSETSKFNDTFKINTGEKLNVSLGENSTFGLLSGATSTSISLKAFLNNNTSNKINLTSFGKGASLFYVKAGAKAILDENYTITNGNAESTAILVGTEINSKIDIASGKKLETNTHVGLVATNGATAENSGTVESTRETGVGIYTSSATATNSATGTIKMTKEKSVGILGENNSTLKNSKEINLAGKSSAGIYGKDSDITQDNTAEVKINEDSSAGIYALLTSVASSDKTITNDGKIDALDPNKTSSAGIYANLENMATKKLTINNNNKINISQKSSAGIYIKNESNQNKESSMVNNSGLINIDGESSIGIIGEKSKITNIGNGTNGIEVKSSKSAGILTKANSEAINSGRILLEAAISNSTEGLVGISADETSTANNSGSIDIKANYSTGISSAGGKITNSGTINLENKDSVAISANNADVDNVTNGTITVKKENSVGIYSKLNVANDKTVNNGGTISLEGTTGAKKSAAIYALLDNNSTGKLTVNNNGNIKVDQEESVGIFIKNNSSQPNTQSIATNSKTITVSKEGSAAMIAEKSVLFNSSTNTGEGIILTANKTGGIIAKSGSKVENSGNIETKTASPTSATEGLVGISLESSIAENTSTGKITLDTKYSTGMYGANSSTLENKGEIIANKDYVIGMAGKSSTVTNNNKIHLKEANSTGIFGETNSTLKNTGSITAEKSASVGIFSKENSNIAENTGTIEMKENNSAGMYGDKGALKNANTITASGTTSAGMFAKNTNAINEMTIKTSGTTSAGILVEVSEDNITAKGSNDDNGTITIEGNTSAGMYGKLLSGTGVNSKLELINKNTIHINSETSVGMMAQNASSLSRDKISVINKGTIILNTSKTKNIGILADKSTGTNEKAVEVKGKESIGMLAKNGSIISNTGTATITLEEEKGIGMFAENTNTEANNEGSIKVQGKESSGMLAKSDGKIWNKKSIEVIGEKGVGIFVSDAGTGENTSTGTINLKNKNAVGIFAKNNDTNHSALNSGKIVLDTTNESLIGMFAQAESGKQASVKNATGATIEVNTKKSVGIYGENKGVTVTDVDLSNEGTVKVNNESSAGIYSSKATISKVGKIELTNIANGASAVYVSNGGKVITDNADISLGTANQNRVAYYISGAESSLSGNNIGKISGYGVGVYLIGNSSSDIAKLDSSTPELNYTTGTNGGNGIIGLLLKGNTNISAYNKGITVGNTIPANGGDTAKYAIGVYTDKQGTSGALYKFSTKIKTGENGVGIFADKDSFLEYSGELEVGNGTNAGTGIFINKNSAVTLGNAKIKLNGKGGVAAIVSEGAKFDGGTATIDLQGAGVGVYGLKGSTINISNWTFNNNGHQAEEVRTVEGVAHIVADKSLKPRMVLTHVINGETSLESKKTVKAINDGNIEAQENIGLMAEGIKNPTAPTPLTWQNGNFEIVNKGTIDFSNSKKSTAIYVESAKAQNDGVLKIGENSTGIYGIYKNSTRKYKGAPAGHTNKLEIETTTNSKIELGIGSVGMYLVNAEKINNLGGEIKGTGIKNVGIYAVNGQDMKAANNKILTINNKAIINLDDGSVGLYSKGKSDTEKNMVTNTGSITVGKKLNGSPAVAIYVENTKLENNSDVTVGEDGIAFYGKNAEVNINGGNINFQKKGILAYLENSKLVSKIGDLTSTQNTMLYLKNSTAKLDGAGTKVNMTVANNYTGAYIEGVSKLEGIQSIKLGENSNGLFLKDANFTSDAVEITGSEKRVKAILATNSKLVNKSKISLSGDESIGIYSNADNTKSVVNEGDLTLAGKKTLGVFLKDSQSFENKANIEIKDSINKEEPTIGIYTKEGISKIVHTSGNINVGEKSIGIYSTVNADVEMNAGKLIVKDQGIGIYKQSGKGKVNGKLEIASHMATDKNTEPVAVYAVNGTEVEDKASSITIGEKSYGFILNNTDSTKTNIYKSSNTGTVSMGNDSVFLYSNGKAEITNNRTISANNSDHLIAFYIKDQGTFTTNGTIDFSTGKGNIAIYASSSVARNKGRILVGRTDDTDPKTGKVYSDVSKIVYGIGMAADNGGHIINDGEIRVFGNKSIAMYGKGMGTTVENTVNGKIYLDGSKATTTDKIQSMTGVYVDEGATFINRGDIRTTEAYAGKNGKVNTNVSGLVGVAVMNGSTLENHGNIEIDANNSYGVVIRGKRDTNGNIEKYATIKNYGNIKVRGSGTYGISWKDVSESDIRELEKQINSKIISDPSGHEIGQASGTDKDYEGVKITVKDGKPTFSRNGQPVSEKEIAEIEKLIGPNLSLSDIGFYVDTLGRTKPMDIDGGVPRINSQLIVGTEYSEKTNAKQWFVKDEVIKPFLNQIQGRNFKLTSLAGSLTWMATPVLDNHGEIVGIAMAKIPYTSFTDKTENTYNFSDGLEQRYDMNSLSSTEKQIFNKLNGVGKNEQALLVQAFDEMMGHQ
ncbi:membrane protein, partial [Fusobacterium necrophorum BFTR-2]